jgi:hypothetical protein
VWWARGCPGSDIEAHAEDLRNQNWTEDAIAMEREEAARLAEPGLIWPENWTAVCVFSGCRWEKSQGLKKVYFDGITAMEIFSVCQLQQIPNEEWPDVLERVRVMEYAAQPVLNEE